MGRPKAKALSIQTYGNVEWPAWYKVKLTLETNTEYLSKAKEVILVLIAR